MYIERYNSISGIEAKLQRVHPKPSVCWFHPSGSSSCSSTSCTRTNVKQALTDPTVLLIKLPCSSCHLFPFPPSKDFQVHLNVTLSVDFSPSLAQPSFLPKGFHIPLCKRPSFSFAQILYHSCFYKGLSFLQQCEVFEDLSHPCTLSA